MTDKLQYKRVMTIAGSDCSGGAGIQADIKTISAIGCYASSAITAVVDENTVGVAAVHHIPTEMVVGQMRSILSDIGTDAVKIGMLGTAEMAIAVADALAELENTPVVLDPVMVATSGDRLTSEAVISALKDRLMSVTTIITPNIPEAEALTGHKITTIDEMKDAAAEISTDTMAVLLKGGHLTAEPLLTDVYYDPRTNQMLELPAPKVDTPNTHGTGCTLSSAIAAYMAKGLPMLQAVVAAKEYMIGAISAGAAYTIGKGHGPVCHFHNLWRQN